MIGQNYRAAHSQRGIVITEYVVGTLLLGLVLFTPIPGIGESAFTYLLQSLRGFQANTTYLMSLP